MPKSKVFRLPPERREELKGSLLQWHTAFHPDFKTPDFHTKLIAAPPEMTGVTFTSGVIPAIERLFRGEGKSKLAIFKPPQHGTSEIATVSGVSWYLANHAGHNAMTLSYGDDLAKKFGRSIKSICNSDMAYAVVPGVRCQRDSRSVKEFTTEQNNEYHATGFKGSIAGLHLDLLDIDDPVKSMSAAKSELDMDTLFEIYSSVVKFRLKPGGKILLNMQRFWLRDFAARVLADEPGQWDVLLLDAEKPDGTYLWEEHHGRQHYDSAKRNLEVWWSVFRQRPMQFDEYWFKEEWFRTYKPEDLTSTWVKYMICDPGLSTGKKANRTSIVVLAAGPNGVLYVVDWVYDRLDPDQRTAAIVRLWRKWKPRRFVYEATGMNADLWYLDKAFKAAKIHAMPIGVGKKGPRAFLSKETRIEELKGDFCEARIRFPEQLEQRCVDGTVIDVIQEFKVREYLPYRGKDSIDQDDGLDSLSRIHDNELRPDYVAPPKMETAEVRQLPGSWEAYY